MPVTFKQAGPVIARWDDVVTAMYGKPYRLVRTAQIHSSSIARAKAKGHFDETLARRIHAATNKRLPLYHPNGELSVEGYKWEWSGGRNVRRTIPDTYAEVKD